MSQKPYERAYNKLVRDRVPALIAAQGETPVVRILDDGEYAHCLRRKLREEVDEYLLDGSLSEICDILEVLSAIATAAGVTPDEVERTRREKANKNGAFHDRIFLEKVIERPL